MNEDELRTILACGQLYIGVADDVQVSELNAADVARLNQLLSNAASQNVRATINPVTPLGRLCLQGEIHERRKRAYQSW
jgi:hypothetical protein